MKMFSEEQKAAMANDPPVIDAEFAEVEEESGSSLTIIQPAALEAITRAEFDVQVATAKRYPRPPTKIIRDRIKSLSCVDQETAEECIYVLRRKDKKTGETKLIEGPSVRFAEICVHCAGNMRAYSRIISNDGKKITSQGVAFDLEQNNQFGVEVSRRITDRLGRTFSDDLQILTGNAANSIAFRNAVFKVLPLGLWKPAYQETKRVAAGDAATLVARRDEMFKRFAPLGGGKREILQLLEKESVESIDLEDLAVLVGLLNAIAQGEITAKEIFAAPVDDEAGKPLKERMRAKIDARKAKK